MAFPSQEQIDIIATKILFNAKEAILQLKGWNNDIDKSAQKTLFFKEIIKATAKQVNGDMKVATEAVIGLARAVGVNLAIIKQLGKELQAISLIAKNMGISFSEAESRFGGFAIIVSGGTKELAVFGSVLQASIASGLPLLTAMQTSLVLISTQIDIIKSQLSGGLIGGGSIGGVPLLGSGGSSGRGGGDDVIDADWSEIPSSGKAEWWDKEQINNQKKAWDGVTDSANKASQSTKNATTNAEKFGGASQKATKTAESGFGRVKVAVNAVKIAMGVIISMLIFGAIQAVTNFFKESIDQAKQFEETLYRIQNVEKQLSEEGTDISIRGLKKGINDIQESLPIFSKEDIAQEIGGIATATKELGLTEQQILKLGLAVAILNKKSTDSEDLLQTMGKVLNPLLSPQAKSVGELGLSFGKARIEAVAHELQILKVGEAYEDLTEKEKSLIKYAIILKAANIDDSKTIEELGELIREGGGEFEALAKFLESNTGRVEENDAAWKDLKTTFGQLLLPFLPAFTDFFRFSVLIFQALKVSIAEVISGIITLGMATKMALEGDFGGSLEAFQMKIRMIKDAADQIVLSEFFPDDLQIDENAPNFLGFRDQMELLAETINPKIRDAAETATGAIDNLLDNNNEETEKALTDIDEKIQDIILDAKQARDDLDLKLEQKQADLDTEYDHKREDAARDHANKLKDIDLDAQNKIADAKAKAKEDEKKAEQDLLQKLKELRRKFLLDLEEALHERDARQVIRLIKEYKLEKQNILERKKLDDQARKDRLAEDLKAIETERQRRIEDENRDYRRKLADLSLAKAREQEELQLWYKREQEDIERNVQQKLEKLLAGYIAEEKIHETEQAKIYAILAKYFAKDMALVDAMAQFMASRFALATMQYQTAIPLSISPKPTTTTQKAKSDPMFQRHNFAEGGTYIATKPTTAMFGERGAEMATFTPLGRSGRDVNKIFGDLSGGGVNGQILVSVDLSEGLEARIVNRSLEGVADVVGRVNRRKM